MRRHCRASLQNFTYRKLLLSSRARRSNIFGISAGCYPASSPTPTSPLRNIVEMDPCAEVKQNPSQFERETQYTFTRSIVFRCIVIDYDAIYVENAPLGSYFSPFWRIMFLRNNNDRYSAPKILQGQMRPLREVS
jgi:hypothetical protein